MTKLADRGSHQALGIVTDVGLFVRDLAGTSPPATSDATLLAGAGAT